MVGTWHNRNDTLETLAKCGGKFLVALDLNASICDGLRQWETTKYHQNSRRSIIAKGHICFGLTVRFNRCRHRVEKRILDRCPGFLVFLELTLDFGIKLGLVVIIVRQGSASARRVSPSSTCCMFPYVSASRARDHGCPSARVQVTR